MRRLNKMHQSERQFTCRLIKTMLMFGKTKTVVSINKNFHYGL